MSYNQKFDLDLAHGQVAENLFATMIGNGLVECKRDRLAHQTGNVFIEYEYRGKPAGIAATQADWYAIAIDSASGDIERWIVASVAWLKDACRPYLNTKQDCMGGDDGQSRGILLPIAAFGKESRP